MEKINITLGNGRIICELNENDLNRYKLLGKAIGLDIYHCLFLGNKYRERFLERVCGYKIPEDKQSETFTELTGKKYISVEFFEKV